MRESVARSILYKWKYIWLRGLFSPSSHVECTNECTNECDSHLYKWVWLSYKWESHMNEPHFIYDGVTWHTWVSHVTHTLYTNECTNECDSHLHGIKFVFMHSRLHKIDLATLIYKWVYKWVSLQMSVQMSVFTNECTNECQWVWRGLFYVDESAWIRILFHVNESL